MEIGCHLPTQGPVATREALLTFCREAEARDVASLWVSDHVVFPRTATGSYPGGRFPFDPDTPYLEPVAVLAAAAVATERARLGCSVFVLGHRHPVLMAKLLTTVDALSNGRLICGVGVGWWAEELTLLGADFPRRGRQADEMLRIFKALWTEDHPTFAGEFYRFDDLGFAPKPVQRPHPPIWVGGGDNPAVFRRVAALGDGWHASSKTPDQVRDALPRLRAAAEAAGRPFESLDLSVRVSLKQASVAARREAIVEQLRAYRALGLTHAVLDFRRDTLAEMLEDLDVVTREIRPAVEAA